MCQLLKCPIDFCRKKCFLMLRFLFTLDLRKVALEKSLSLDAVLKCFFEKKTKKKQSMGERITLNVCVCVCVTVSYTP